MNERRFQQLEAKKKGTGLTREEADELGRMYAEKMGQPYSNADQRQPDEESFAEEGTPASEEQLEEFAERGEGQAKEA